MSRLPAVVMCLPLLLTACGGKSNGSNKKVQNIFVHGDPMAVIAGSTLTKTPTIAVADLSDLSGFNLYGGAYFHQKSQASTATESEEGNEASTGEDADELNDYEFVADANGYVLRDSKNPGSFDFTFTSDGTHLALSAVTFDGSSLPVTPLHYSVSAGKTRFSLLFALEDPSDGPGILGVFFTKNESLSAKIDQGDTIYKYLLGPGIKAQWNQPIKIDICGNVSASDEAALRKGIIGWSTSSGMIGTRTLTIGTKKSHPPFSDVNSTCVELVDNFYFEDQENAAVYGITMTSINKTTASIVNSNIIISQTSFQKTPETANNPTARTILLEYVTSHEVGHLLGLDHEFTQNADGTPVYQSIMSYEFDNISDETPRAHDREAILGLYSDPIPES